MGEPPPIAVYCFSIEGVRREAMMGAKIRCMGNGMRSWSWKRRERKPWTSGMVDGPPMFIMTIAVGGLDGRRGTSRTVARWRLAAIRDVEAGVALDSRLMVIRRAGVPSCSMFNDQSSNVCPNAIFDRFQRSFDVTSGIRKKSEKLK